MEKPISREDVLEINAKSLPRSKFSGSNIAKSSLLGRFHQAWVSAFVYENKRAEKMDLLKG